MMTIPSGAGAPDYFPCRYGASRPLFRGPERDLSRPYVAMLGGSQTFGKYVKRPFPDLVEQRLGQPVANLGALNAGPDFYLANPPALEVAARAKVAVVQITGAEALSNPFYSVHGRRNDRVLTTTPALRTLFPGVDFTEIHFARHLLQVLARADAAAFATVRAVLRQTWVQRMRDLLHHLPRRRLLLWLAPAPPSTQAGSLDRSPMFVDQSMLDTLAPEVAAIVLAMPSARALARAPLDMAFPETEAAQAACLPGAAVHAEVADRLAPVLRAIG